MNLWLPVIVLFGALFACLVCGLPMSFALGTSAIIAAIIFMGPGTLAFVFSSTYGVMGSLILVAIPLFLFMATVLERSGIADALYTAMHHWMGPLRGGLSMATVLICTVIAAMSGVAAAGTITMGLIALPVILKRGYDKTIAIGSIMAGGALGMLIPPSVAFIIFGMLTRVSVGRLFAGGLVPGLILSSLYVSYIGIRCYFRPQLGPVIPPEERISLKKKIILSRGVILPVLLVFAVLGSIFLGIASITEAAAVGAAGAVVCAAIHRRFNWQSLKEICYRSVTINGMVMWIIFGAACFSSIFIATGASRIVGGFMIGLEIEPFYVIVIMMLTYFILGFVIDDITIMFLTIPIYLPILLSLGYDPVWFGVLFLINTQTGMLTPPFGYCLFYMRGIAPPGVSIGDIYRSVIPFIGLQCVGLLLVMFFPQLALWLPNVIFGLK